MTTETLPSIRDLIGPAATGSDAELTLASIIDGRGVDASELLAPRISPATGRVLFHAGDVTEAAVPAAVAAARAEVDEGEWGRSTGRTRSKVMWKTAEIIDGARAAFAALIVAETGKPLTEAEGEVAATVNAFEYFAGLARDVGGRTIRDIDRNLFAFTIREPAGVAGLLIPWNFPMAILGQKLPAALAAGCAAVIKPSPFTPLSSLAVVNALLQAGLPPAAAAVVLGDAAVGAAVVEHPDVDVISFTGSTPTGRAIAATAGKNRLKRVAMEAGGKTPVIVLADADLDRAVERILFHSFFNQGQVCVAGSRILAERAIADELGARVAHRAAAIRLGDPYDPRTQMGPLISEAHFTTVQTSVDKAREQGATLLTGGAEAAPADTTARPFLAPTVLSTEADDNLAVTGELFGPVTVIQPFTDLADAVHRANSSEFGLAASVWTSNLEAALLVTESLKTGTVWINGSTDSHPEIPLGGRRDSGYGAEFGREGMEFFTDIKTVHIARQATEAWYLS